MQTKIEKIEVIRPIITSGNPLMHMQQPHDCYQNGQVQRELCGSILASKQMKMGKKISVCVERAK